MTPQVEARLHDLIEPIRDQTVGDLLQALAAELDGGAEVVAEPVERDADGRVVRSGTLRLPRRHDLRVTRVGRSRVRRVPAPAPLSFEPLCMVAESGFTTVISPFRWEAADLVVETRESRPDWRPLRLWFLDWFQSRFSELAPDLDGALHTLCGPHPVPEGHRFTLDLGSAPLAALPGLIGAMEESGSLRMRVGEEGWTGAPR